MKINNLKKRNLRKMSFIVKSNIYCDNTKKIVAVFCDREDALDYIKKFDFDNDTVAILEYWKGF
jgi:hypothetical protein